MKTFFNSLLLLCVLSAGALAAQKEKPDSRAQCLQKCLEQYRENIEKCKDACLICQRRFLFICVSRVTDESCLATCKAGAVGVYEACKAECPELPQP
jgi:hypothetical protein